MCAYQISEAFYRKKRTEGKGYHHQAAIALARRRIDVFWVMLRNGEIYLSSLRKRLA